jgi:tetratricopeptide (TPR) repeat protein
MLVRESLLSEIDLKKATVYYHLGDFDKAADFTANALKHSRKLKQRDIEFFCTILLSRIGGDNKIKIARTALEIAENMKLPPLIALALFTINQLAQEIGDQEKVRYYGRKALLLYDDIKSKLKDENRRFFTGRPEYNLLLGV